MAKKKKKVTHHQHRRRRISGTGSFDLAAIGGLIAGAVASQFVDKLPFISTLDGKLMAAAKIGIGAYLPHFAGKSPFVHAVGHGMIAAGGLELVGPKGLNMISGLGETDMLTLTMPGNGMSGINDLPTVSGLGDINTISGFEDTY
jgi:hypothetical protein